MKNSPTKKIIHFIALKCGNMLVYLQPKKARQLSENRITLIHKNKNNLTITERLMRFALVNKLEKIKDHKTIAKLNHEFWVNNKATELFKETENSFHTHFLPKCAFIFDILKEELSNESKNFTTLVEIGTGDGEVLNYLSSEFPKIKRFVGIDLSKDQVEKNTKKFRSNNKLEFVNSDALDWIKAHGHSNTIFVARDTLEYFLEPNLQDFFKEVHRLGNVIFIAIEPNSYHHNFETNHNTELYGNEPSFSHNYPVLFKNAGFDIWHFSQKPFSGYDTTQTFVGARS